MYCLLYNCFKSRSYINVAYNIKRNKTAHNFSDSVSLLIIPFFIILNFLNKKESKVICMREFEIILFQTQSLSIKPKGSLVL
jgi:hypothetical protein